MYRLYDLPWFRMMSWYFLLTSDYFFFGESLIDYWGIVLRKDVSLFVQSEELGAKSNRGVIMALEEEAGLNFLQFGNRHKRSCFHINKYLLW